MKLLQNNSQTYSAAILEYLIFACGEKEKITRIIENTNGHVFLYTETGISKLKIERGTYLKPIYLDNPLEIEELLNKYTDETKRIIFVVNLDKHLFDDEKAKRMIQNYNILFSSDFVVNKREYRIKKEIIAIDKSYKRKCIHIDRFDELLFYIIRFKIIANIINDDFDPSKIYSKPGQNSVFPFIYNNDQIKIIVYEEKKQLNNQFYSTNDNEKYELVKVLITKNNRSLILRVNSSTKSIIKNRYFEFKEIESSDLISHVESFNSIYGSFFPDDFIDLYKYRKFEKTRYGYDNETYSIPSHMVFKYTESEKIEIGIRSALEDDIIWFSNYESLNDPFDLKGRIPAKYNIKMVDYYNQIIGENYKTVDTGFLTFCSTSREDNILMWSHYGDSHKGTCIRYPMIELIKTIEGDSGIDICFYGNIKYMKNRTSFVVPFTTFRFLDINLALIRFNIICMFEKYKDWEYENEFRFLIVPNHRSKTGYGAVLQGKDLIIGKNFPIASYNSYISKFYTVFRQLELSNDEYKLL